MVTLTFLRTTFTVKWKSFALLRQCFFLKCRLRVKLHRTSSASSSSVSHPSPTVSGSCASWQTGTSQPLPHSSNYTMNPDVKPFSFNSASTNTSQINTGSISNTGFKLHSAQVGSSWPRFTAPTTLYPHFTAPAVNFQAPTWHNTQASAANFMPAGQNTPVTQDVQATPSSAATTPSPSLTQTLHTGAPYTQAAFANAAYRSRSVTVPPFFQHDPALWFMLFESELHLLNIVDDYTKHCALLKALTPAICKSISPIIRSLPLDNKYRTLKDHLIKKFSQSVQEKINQLFRECTLADKKPSELFTEMQALAQGHVPDNTLLLLWSRALLNELAVQLDEAITSSNAQQAIAKADRLHERLKPLGYTQIASISPEFSAPSSEEDLISRISEKVICAISAQTNSRKSRPVDKKKKSERSKSQTRMNFGLHKDLCFYHYRYREKAKNCPGTPCAAPKYEKEWRESRHLS
ncbi:hypothetical protein TKK_0017607 [Trichogramma kaykai]